MKLTPLLLVIYAALVLIAVLPADEGMWMPHQMQELHLERLGLKMNPEKLYKEDGFALMNAIVYLGGGTGAFVSKEGLILTNHHVAFSTIQQASDAQHDYLQDGFIAWNKKEELPAIGKYADVLISYEEITEKIVGKIRPEMSLQEKWDTLDKEQKKIIKALEAESPDTRIKIAAIFNGKKYYMYRFKRLRDLRIVYAPPVDLGRFGGEIDNWMWPRHTADFTFLRAYISPDNVGQVYHKDNIPYQPESHLKISLNGFREGDFTFVMGYPGKTYRNESVAEFKYAMDLMNQRINKYQNSIDFYESFTQGNREVELKYASKVKSLHNSQKNYKGKLEGFEKRAILQEKQAIEESLKVWIDLNTERKKIYSTVFDEMDFVIEEKRVLQKKMDLLTDWISRYFGPNMLYIAHEIYRTVYEREKPDMERDAKYQERNYNLITDRIMLADRNFDLEVDQAFFQKAMLNLKNLPAEELPDALRKLLSRAEEILSAKFVSDLYQRSSLVDPKARKTSFEMNLRDLISLDDPFIQIVQEIESELYVLREQKKLLDLKKNYISQTFAEIILNYTKGRIAPDANSTIRFTYGYIQGYSPKDGIYFKPQTSLPGVIEKDQGKYPFNVPEELKSLYYQNDYGIYADQKLRTIPVCFLNTTNVTGGNSGSPTLDANGNLVGVIFDMTYESIIGDYYIIPELQRTLSVDIRYILFITEKVAGAKHIISEIEFSESPH
jgi:hypothetical protein